MVLKEVVQQPEPELKKTKRNRTLKDFGPEFKLYLIEGTMDEVSDQHCYCFNVDNDPKTFDEAMKSQDVANLLVANRSSKENPKVDGTIEKFKMDVKTAFLYGDLDDEVYMNQPQGFIMPGNENKVDMTNEFLSSKFSMKDMGEADVILVSTPMDTSGKLMPNNGQAVSQLEYSRVIGCLMYAMTCTWPDIAFAVGKLSMYTSNPVLEGYNNASWINNTEDNSSTSGW
ncbi:zinc finger, CCHC-type containing protein, partial [Tanacetum coccineum]